MGHDAHMQKKEGMVSAAKQEACFGMAPRASCAQSR